jgi:hypothetical protein
VRRVRPGRIPAAIAPRVRGARYAIGDVLYVIGRFARRTLRAIRRGVSAFWWGLGVPARQRLVAALGTVVALILFLGFAVPNLPCQVPGAGPCPPPDDAEDLVPSSALAYVHATVDPDSDQYAEADEIAAHLPTITTQILSDALGLLPGAAGTRLDFARDVSPWFGGQAAFAELPGGRRGTEGVALLEVDDSDGAAAFAEEAAAGQSRPSNYRDVEIAVDRDGLATAQVEGFLTIGAPTAVRAVIDVATDTDGSSSIADDPAASEIRDEIPDHRLAEAYLSPEGAERFVAETDGALAPLAPFAAVRSTRGVAAALSADDGALELAVRSAIDPERARAEPGFFAAFTPFEPELPERLPEDSLAYVGFGDPEGTVAELLAQAAVQAPGVAGGFEGLARELRRDGDIDIEGQLLPALGEEAALVIEPRADPGEDVDPAPFLEIVARDVDEERARNALARLQRPIVDALEPAIGLQAPVFRDREVAGVEARSLQVSPTIDLTYAVADDLAVIATDPLGVERLLDGDGALDDAALFERATEGFPETLSLLAFLDVRGLILAAEQLGLGADPVYGVLAPEIRALRTVALAVRLEDEQLATDARLIVEPPGEEEAPLPPVEPEAPPELEVPPDTPGFEPPPRGPGFEPPPQGPGFEPPGLPGFEPPPAPGR